MLQRLPGGGMSSGLVVGTAGHIDHGKTSLVRALTGVDLDALPEERERGITIALGFTPLDLPDGRRVAMVDVPGHERLVRTMVAGATGLDAVLLCISAVDGAMPQTREHLAILDLVGVRQGAVVLTMADLVDEELLELAMEDAAELVEGTFLEGAPVIASSATTGRGKQELLEVIASFSRGERASVGPFRLPVDRAFVQSGFGTVVTGTSWSGELVDGSGVRLLPGGRSVRVRGIQVHGESVDKVGAGHRVALNLAGVEKQDVPRGTLIVRGDVPETSMIDVMYTHLPDAPEVEDGAQVRVLLGTAERIGRLHLAVERDLVESGRYPAQIRLDEPLPCLPGDRFVVRWASPVITLGGGVIVDPWAPRMRRKNRAAHGQATKRLAAGETLVWLERAGEVGLPVDAWRQRSEAPAPVLGDRAFAPRVLGRLEGALLEALTAYHAEAPLSLGAHRRELRRGRLGHLDEKVFDSLVDRMANSGLVAVHGPLVRLSGFSVEPTPAQHQLKQRIAASLADAGFVGLPPKELHKLHPEPEVEALARLLEADGAAVLVPAVGWMDASVLVQLRERLRAHFEGHDALAPADFKEMTELSRKTAIPLLEWLDKSKWTARRGDARIRGSAL
ncbi:MAG: selenocysteine-specific translation elongation factor [Deltaproteobacteria bacterium]|nr:MAG: selenocysteine-specific translation elongation factor [Deltaproteobacteria bacterium]